jgi:ribosome biogenesis protein Nip4
MHTKCCLESRRPRSRWEDNIKMNLSEIGFLDVDWIYLVQVETGGRLF